MTNERTTAPDKGTTLTAIDVRKALLAAGYRPSAYDEQAIWEHCNHWGINRWDSIIDIAEQYKK